MAQYCCREGKRKFLEKAYVVNNKGCEPRPLVFQSAPVVKSVTLKNLFNLYVPDFAVCK